MNRRNPFRFKQFTVEQNEAAMAVTTDSCVMGARIMPGGAKTILDVGTGTGVLSLMIAQKCEALITAIEYDLINANTAALNFANSPWASRFKLICADALEWSAKNEGCTFDLIVCNPPFFGSHLPATDTRRNIARHSATLAIKDLASFISSHLTPTGAAWIMFPPEEMHTMVALSSQYGLVPANRLLVASTSCKKPHIEVVCFRNNQSTCTNQYLLVHNEAGNYTPEFKALLSPYYLNL